MIDGKNENRIVQRASELFAGVSNDLHVATDRLFIVLMVIQWVGGMLIAFVISPLTWDGAEAQVHIHLWAAILLGGTISAAPIFLAITFPGATLTRHVVAVAQMCWSSLLIHLMGGRLETHFHVFGSLAFIAFYRDWKVLLTATTVTAVDHFVRGVWWPESVYGVVMTSPYRWLEHAAWVIFEDIFLIISCLRSNRDSAASCARQAELEFTKHEIELRVEERTSELQKARASLSSELEEHKKTQAEREKLYSDLASASRQAGMAEVATGVLHNVGNVLNSVNVSVDMLVAKLKGGTAATIERLADLLEKQQDLGKFFAEDPRAQKLPGFLSATNKAIACERDEMKKELAGLRSNVDHIKQIVTMQQSYACSRDMLEPLRLTQLIEDAVNINRVSLDRHEVNVQRNFDEVPEVHTDKHKVMQVLVNLIKNAAQATQENTGLSADNRRVDIDLRVIEQNVEVAVRDNGVGIAPENLGKMFTHGFTTKKDGHGFGLHSASLAIKELGGSLTVSSEGVGRGACFTLALPRGKETTEKIDTFENPRKDTLPAISAGPDSLLGALPAIDAK